MSDQQHRAYFELAVRAGDGEAGYLTGRTAARSVMTVFGPKTISGFVEGLLMGATDELAMVAGVEDTAITLEALARILRDRFSGETPRNVMNIDDASLN